MKTKDIRKEIGSKNNTDLTAYVAEQRAMLRTERFAHAGSGKASSARSIRKNIARAFTALNKSKAQ